MRARSMFLVCMAPFALALVQGCGQSDEEALGDCGADSDALQATGRAALDANCLKCHSKTATSRNGAPGDKNMDDLAYVRKDAAAIYAEVSDGSMPPAGPLPDASIEAIQAYLACGAK
jgi:mono/diheme cytochrome c family protein